jgi:hypothetical protein
LRDGMVEFRTDVFDADSIEGLFDEWSRPCMPA